LQLPADHIIDKSVFAGQINLEITVLDGSIISRYFSSLCRRASSARLRAVFVFGEVVFIGHRHPLRDKGFMTYHFNLNTQLPEKTFQVKAAKSLPADAFSALSG